MAVGFTGAGKSTFMNALIMGTDAIVDEEGKFKPNK